MKAKDNGWLKASIEVPPKMVASQGRGISAAGGMSTGIPPTEQVTRGELQSESPAQYAPWKRASV